MANLQPLALYLLAGVSEIDGFRPDRYDVIGGVGCFADIGIIRF